MAGTDVRPAETDIVLRVLGRLPDPLGSLVRAFPGRAAMPENPNWLDGWFNEQTRAFSSGAAPNPLVLTTHDPLPGELSLLAKPPVTSSVRLTAVLPHFFRGFRHPKQAVNLEEDLVLIEGANSSGKTSLSEAIEWVLTGVLSRHGAGHPREMANCIGNEFRPIGEQTWVECFLLVDDKPTVLRRLLVSDYSEKATEGTQSELYRDGQSLSRVQEQDLFTNLFAGLPPILMQHTLRQFVHDSPDDRRQYFERLLQIDELTGLIEKAVVGDVRRADFDPPGAAVAYSRWQALHDSVQPATKKALEKHQRAKEDQLTAGSLQIVLLAAASSEFAELVPPGSSFSSAVDALEKAQGVVREARFPLLSALKPVEELSALPQLAEQLVTASHVLERAAGSFETSRLRVNQIQRHELPIARAVDQLVAEGLLSPEPTAAVTCPMCEHEDVPTLTALRIKGVLAHLPLVAAFDNARGEYTSAQSDFKKVFQGFQRYLDKVIPKTPTEDDLKSTLNSVDDEVGRLARAVHSSSDNLRALLAEQVAQLNGVGNELVDASKPSGPIQELVRELLATGALVTAFNNQYQDLERAVGLRAQEDPRYSARARWLDVAADPDGVVQALRWEGAKIKAQELLATLRNGLINLRTKIIEDARRTFSERMTDVWNALRRDTSSRFSRLTIPAARGRGYKLEMEVKAILNDGTTDKEVDALKVFSESQINVLGLAAYITRACLLGHRTLVFDDPVQSMDEEHYRSFSTTLLTALLSIGLQVIVLTHSEHFARDIAEHQYMNPSFATMQCRGSRRQGCQVDEGNRRVAERLKTAENLADDGKLSDAWKAVRLGLERLYLVTRAKRDAKFEPRSWREQTAEHMWDNGAGPIIEGLVPNSGVRLREILTLSNAGAHDKAPPGITDLKNSVDYVRSLLNPLQVGNG